MDPVTMALSLATEIVKLLDTWAQNELLIAQSLAPADRTKWATDQMAMRQPFVDAFKTLAAHFPA